MGTKTGLMLPKEAFLNEGNGEVFLDLTALESWIEKADDKSVGVLIADGLPVLKKIASVVSGGVLARMKARKQKVMTLGDGRKVALKTPNVYDFDKDALRRAKAAFVEEGKSDLSEVAGLHQMSGQLKITKEVLEKLGLNRDDIEALPEYDEYHSYAGAQLVKNAIKQGGPGAEILEEEIKRARSDGKDTLETAGKRTADPNRFKAVKEGIQPERNPWSGDEDAELDADGPGTVHGDQ